MKIVFLMIFTALASCKSKEKEYLIIGKIKIDPIWSECAQDADCAFKFDQCKNIYYINKKYEVEAEKQLERKFDGKTHQICVDLADTPDPTRLECKKNQCTGIFSK